MRPHYALLAFSLGFPLTLLPRCGGSGEASDEAFRTTATDSGSLLTRVNASDEAQWVFVDLDDTDAFLVDSEQEARWDLAFKRQLVRLHNDQLVAIAILDDTEFSSVNGSPRADQFFNDSSQEEDDLAFSQQRGWYAYNLLKHELKPRQPRTYVVRSGQGTLYKLAFRDYYDDQGHGGYPQFEWARVDGKEILTPDQREPCSEEETERTIKAAIGQSEVPSTGALTLSEPNDQGVITVTLDASLGGPEQAAGSSYLYLDLANGTLLKLSDVQASRSSAWQIAFKRSELRANSKDSGPGRVVVALTEEPLESLSSSPLGDDDQAWREDDFVDPYCDVKTFGLDFIETSFGQWYEYDFKNHVARVKPQQTYLIHDRDAELAWGFSIESYQGGRYTWRQKRLEP